MKIVWFFLFFLLNGFSAFTQDYHYLRLPKHRLTKEWIRSSGFIEDHMRNERYVVGYLPINIRLPDELRESSVTLDPKEWSTRAFDLDTLNPLPAKASSLYGPQPLPAKHEGLYDIQAVEEYHTYETLTTELKTLATKYPQWVTLESAGKTVEGREMWFVRLTNRSVTLPSKPKLLLISSMHGDEVAGKEIMVYLIRFLLSQNRSGSSIRNWLDNNELFIMPSMNPDGTEKHQRFNANGVDLNRDFPELTENPNDPNHAIEVRNIQKLHQQHHFLTALNFHGGELCVNIPWDSLQNNQGALFGDNTLMVSLARSYADQNTPMKNNHGGNFNHGVTYGYEWYPIYGGMQDWASFFHQSTHATVEISSIKWPSPSALPGFWKDNLNSLLGFLERSIKGIHLKVTNSSGELLPVEVELGSAQRLLKYSGYVHRPSSMETEKVTLNSPGFETKVLTLTSSPYQGTFINVVLERASHE